MRDEINNPARIVATETSGSPNMADVMVWLQNERPYAHATIMDYKSQIDRVPVIFGVNRLRDVPADISLFNHRSKQNRYQQNFFKTNAAWTRWSAKISGVLNKFSGKADARKERRGREDAWSELIEYAHLCVGVGTGTSPLSLIPIGKLADEARKANLAPCQLTDLWLQELCDELRPAARKTIGNAVRGLEKLRKCSPDVRALLPNLPLDNPAGIRRSARKPLPDALRMHADRLIESNSGRIYDPISDEWSGGIGAKTIAVRKAALSAYVNVALKKGILAADADDLTPAFSQVAFHEITREFIAETDPCLKLSARSLRSYIGIIMILGRTLGVDVGFMGHALKHNRVLKEGKQKAMEMAESDIAFCVSLMRNRRREMDFLSLHISAYDKACSLLSGDHHEPFLLKRAVQYGVVAAYSAIALWSVPLRIENMRNLRHLGSKPHLILPRGQSRQVKLIIPKEEVKNKVEIHANLTSGPTKALEVLTWYIDQIRPHIPWADESEYLFPGYDGPQLSEQSIRNWLSKHARSKGLHMRPHNFRHGLATILLRANPGDYSAAARLLCNTPNTVRQHYAWIDHEKEILAAQGVVARQAGYLIDGQEGLNEE